MNWEQEKREKPKEYRQRREKSHPSACRWRPGNSGGSKKTKWRYEKARSEDLTIRDKGVQRALLFRNSRTPHRKRYMPIRTNIQLFNLGIRICNRIGIRILNPHTIKIGSNVKIWHLESTCGTRNCNCNSNLESGLEDELKIRL